MPESREQSRLPSSSTFAERTTQHVALNTKVKNNSPCWEGSRKKKKYRDSSDPKAIAMNKHSWPGHGPLSRT